MLPAARRKCLFTLGVLAALAACQKPEAVAVSPALAGKLAALSFPEAIRCADSQPFAIEGQATGFATCANGLRHRPEISRCPYLPRPLSEFETPGVKFRGSCREDRDCREKPNGSCDVVLPIGTLECHYGCAADADCGQGEICECGRPAGRCQPATCRSDGDCQDGAVCGRYWPHPGCFLDVAYSCQTPLDQCAGDPACKASGGFCTADLAGRRICSAATCLY